MFRRLPEQNEWLTWQMVEFPLVKKTAAVERSRWRSPSAITSEVAFEHRKRLHTAFNAAPHTPSPPPLACSWPGSTPPPIFPPHTRVDAVCTFLVPRARWSRAFTFAVSAHPFPWSFDTRLQATPPAICLARPLPTCARRRMVRDIQVWSDGEWTGMDVLSSKLNGCALDSAQPSSFYLAPSPLTPILHSCPPLLVMSILPSRCLCMRDAHVLHGSPRLALPRLAGPPLLSAYAFGSHPPSHVPSIALQFRADACLLPASLRPSRPFGSQSAFVDHARARFASTAPRPVPISRGASVCRRMRAFFPSRPGSIPPCPTSCTHDARLSSPSNPLAVCMRDSHVRRPTSRLAMPRVAAPRLASP
ncbi:hypothetical protein B0H21DRAFT_896489 [Amylocystis lapponica]|nr:hypothetical protein B0H21DRAFT_896489 [Amylocystis lapponica]